MREIQRSNMQVNKHAIHTGDRNTSRWAAPQQDIGIKSTNRGMGERMSSQMESERLAGPFRSLFCAQCSAGSRLEY